MTDERAAELESLREDGLDAQRRREFRAAARAEAGWQRAAQGVDAILAWIEELRASFGDPPADRRPWRGGDFRL